ncbi:MAG: ubiquitin-like domain-containing protein [Paenibacillaceae bacterium]
MGNIEIETPHGRRSTSMSSAISWKRENMRLISTVALSSVAVIFMFLLMLYGTSYKEISLSINGEEQTVTTRQWKLDRLLDEQSIVIDVHDRISIPAHSKLQHGDTIQIEHTHPLALVVDGQQLVMHTTGNTVSEALEDLNIPLNPFDRTVPALEASVKAEDSVRIIRVEKAYNEVEKELPFNIVKTKDTKLAKGKEAVVSEGQEGILIETVEYTYEDGVLTYERVVDSTLAAASVDKVVAVGTKNPVTVLSASSPAVKQVTKKGLTFSVKQILTGVVLTAYDAGFQSTGKTQGHPQYGITFSGTTVEEGRTIAVDPKVIPMGWWVYIEGYGFRRAEDKGSGVKGKHIDIYFEDGDYANEFGKKRGATVYIVGPNKPQAN